MRLAILADIHGNLPAFEAVLRHAAALSPDRMILAGDIVTGSPDSAACWQLAQSLGCPMLRGNHERYAADYGTPKAAAEWSTEKFAPLHWTLAQLTQAERQAMGQLPTSLRLAEAPGLFLVHASERDDHDSIAPHTPSECLQALFPQALERYLVRAHNHYGQVRLWGERLIITGGSVGLPLDGDPNAQYLLLDQVVDGWRVQHQSVPYDQDAAIRRFHDSGYLASSGVFGRLFYREVVTATQQIIPFLRLYARWSHVGELSLSQALDRFLNGF